MNTAVENLVLQGDMDAAGFTILNLNLDGLNLTKNSVGLGNVDNTSDANKPVSTLQAAAIALKEPAITASGNVTDYFGGDKTFHALGALALQGGATTLQELSAIGLNATGSAFVAARRNDAATSFAATYMQHYGASHAGSVLGLSAANVGELVFQNAAYGVIRSNGICPLIFGYNNIRRMRLGLGLTVGADTEAGAGCIEAADTIAALHFEGTDIVLSGGATFGDDLILSGGGANLTVGGNATVAGSLVVTSVLTTLSNLAVGGNAVVSGSIVNFVALPTSNPGVAGQLWRSGNDVKISTG